MIGSLRIFECMLPGFVVVLFLAFHVSRVSGAWHTGAQDVFPTEVEVHFCSNVRIACSSDLQECNNVFFFCPDILGGKTSAPYLYMSGSEGFCLR